MYLYALILCTDLYIYIYFYMMSYFLGTSLGYLLSYSSDVFSYVFHNRTVTVFLSVIFRQIFCNGTVPVPCDL